MSADLSFTVLVLSLALELDKPVILLIFDGHVVSYYKKLIADGCMYL